MARKTDSAARRHPKRADVAAEERQKPGRSSRSKPPTKLVTVILGLSPRAATALMLELQTALDEQEYVVFERKIIEEIVADIKLQLKRK